MRKIMRLSWLSLVCLAAMSGSASAQSPSTTSPPATPQQQLAALHWLGAPALAPVGNTGQMVLQPGIMMLAPPDSDKFLRLQGNPVRRDAQFYVIAPTARHMAWFAVMNYEAIGHVLDQQKINAAKILAAEQRNNKRSIATRERDHLPVLTLTGWGMQPHYDATTHRLEWAFTYDVSGGGSVENMNTRILGRLGVLHIVMVDAPSRLQSDLPAFDSAMNGFRFTAGQRYTDFKKGDKLAKFGLAGLIAGGAAAVAVKTGLFALAIKAILSFSKIIIVGLVAVGAAFRRFFARLFRRS